MMKAKLPQLLRALPIESVEEMWSNVAASLDRNRDFSGLVSSM